MENRYRSYPYPVLTAYNDDYINSNFSANVKYSLEGYNIKFEINTELRNPELENLIRIGKAVFVYSVECSYTGYRKCYRSDQTVITFSIKESDLNGQITIFPFVLAATDLINYKNKEFNSDYEGASFNIEEGKYLAVGQPTYVTIKKKDSDILKHSSIFKIIPNEQNIEEMEVELNDQHIIVRMAQNDYYRSSSMYSNSNIKDILNSAIIVPALFDVLSQLVDNKDDEASLELNYGAYAWYKSIKEILKEKFNMEISDLNRENCFEMAQKMLKTPIGIALKNLVSLNDQGSEEGDD